MWPVKTDEALRNGILQACPWMSEITWRAAPSDDISGSASSTCYLVDDGLWLPFRRYPGGWHAVRWGPEPFTENERALLLGVLQRWDGSGHPIVVEIVDRDGRPQVEATVKMGERWRLVATAPAASPSTLRLSGRSDTEGETMTTGGVSWRPLAETGSEWWTPRRAGTVALADRVC